MLGFFFSLLNFFTARKRGPDLQKLLDHTTIMCVATGMLRAYTCDGKVNTLLFMECFLVH